MNRDERRRRKAQRKAQKRAKSRVVRPRMDGFDLLGAAITAGKPSSAAPPPPLEGETQAEHMQRALGVSAEEFEIARRAVFGT